MKIKKSAKKKIPGIKRQLPTWIVALLPIILGLLATIILLVQLFHSTASDQNQQQVRNLAQAYQQQIELLLGFTDTNGKALAASPLLQQAVLEGNTAELLRLEQEWAQLPYMKHIVITLPGSERAKSSLNFAALDHLGVAATNQHSILEYVVSEQSKFFYQASPVLHPTQSRVIATLLLAYDAEAMLGVLDGPNQQEPWQVQLQQQLPKAPQVELFQAGPGLLASSLKNFPLSHPYWTLSSGIDTPTLAESPWLIRSLLLPLILLLSSLIALFIAQNRLRQHLAKQIQLISESLTGGLPQLPDGPVDKLLYPLFEPVRKLIVRASSTTTRPAVAPVQPANNDTAEQPQQEEKRSFILDEALEIDILDMELDESALLEVTEQGGNPAAVDPGIFRAYDIRGIMGQTLDANTAYWIGRAIGSESIARGEARIVLGRDGRLSGPELHEAAARGVVDTGCTVFDIGMVPTPLVYFATHQLEATSGIMITGSHNPPDYNGFKIVIAGETLSGERITALYERISSGNLVSGSGALQQVDMLPQYLDYITEDVAMGNHLSVVVDCGNGAAGIVAPQLLEKIGYNVIPLYCEVDGTFPNHHPDPGKPENLQDLIRKVQETGANLGLAFDGDGDRLGVVTNTGEIIFPDRLMMLLAKDVVSRNPGADVIFDVKCSRRLPALISRCGGRPVMWKTGHSLMKAKIRETGALLAGEMSGHIFFKERWFGFDDGIYAAARVLEILSMENDSVDRVFARFPVSPSTPELNIEVTEDSKFAIIESLIQSADWGNGNVNTLDGIRVDYPEGWGLIRASNTTPMLVLRFEGNDENELQRIQDLFREQLHAVAPDLPWPF